MNNEPGDTVRWFQKNREARKQAEKTDHVCLEPDTCEHYEATK